MLAVPVSQLRTVATISQCCCPDPAKCHCPDHKPDHIKQPAIRACHKTQHAIVAPDAPAFAAVEAVQVTAPERPVDMTIVAMRSPHAAPEPTRPDAPS